MAFSSQLDARQFLIDKIANQASRTATPLSDVERRMLQLNLDQPQTAAGIPVEVLEDPSREHEKKMAGLLQAAYQRDRGFPEERMRYRAAIDSLQNTDHYILIIASAAIPQKKSAGNIVVYIIIALATAIMIAVLQIWTHNR